MGDRRVEQVEDQPPRAEEPAVADPAQPEDEVFPAGREPAKAVDGEAEGADGPVGDGGEPEVEPDDGSGTEPEPEPEDELAVAQRERQEYLALAQRTQADFENYRKRAAKEAAAAGRRAKSGLIGELLPVVDNLERALSSTGEQEEHLADGVRLVHSELIAVLARNGVEQFDPAGEKFDPALHEALSIREAEGADTGVVLDVVEKGYSLNGTVLRPARVVVSG